MKVLQTFILHSDLTGKTVILAEIIHTTRNYLGYMNVLDFIATELSRISEGDISGLGRAMPARRLLPAYVMMDKDLALLNACSLTFNGCK